MNLETKIHAASWRKMLNIILMLSIGIGFSYGGALANGCRDGVDCLVCAEQTHTHISISHGQMANQSCRPVAEDGACGVETGQRQNEYDGNFAFIGSYHQVAFSIAAALRVQHGFSHFSRAFFSTFLLSNPDGRTAIYLVNQSLLC